MIDDLIFHITMVSYILEMDMGRTVDVTDKMNNHIKSKLNFFRTEVLSVLKHFSIILCAPDALTLLYLIVGAVILCTPAVRNGCPYRPVRLFKIERTIGKRLSVRSFESYSSVISEELPFFKLYPDIHSIVISIYCTFHKRLRADDFINCFLCLL